MLKAVKSVVSAAIGSATYVKVAPAVLRSKTVRNVQRIGQSDADVWIGYYDLDVVNQNETYLAYHRRASGQDFVEVGKYDLQNHKFHAVGKTQCWSYQFAARAQFSPQGSFCYLTEVDGKIGFIEITGTRGQETSSAFPIGLYNFSTCQRYLAEIDYLKIYEHRRGYGIPIGESNDRDRRALAVHQSSAPGEMVACIFDRELPSLMGQYGHVSSAKAEDLHINSPRFSPGGTRIAFLIIEEAARRAQVLVAMDIQTGEFDRCNLPFSSHFVWIDDDRVMVTGRGDDDREGYFIWDITSSERPAHMSGWPSRDGHPALHPNIVGLGITDTYPNRLRYQTLLMSKDGKDMSPIASFKSPLGWGDDKCDLHPRWFPKTPRVAIDLSHNRRRSVGIITLVADCSVLSEGPPADAGGIIWRNVIPGIV